MTEFMRHSDGYGTCKVLCCRGRFYYVQWHDGGRGWCKRRHLTPIVAVHVTENNVLAIYDPEFHGKHYVYISESEWLDYKEFVKREFVESKFAWGHRISALKEKQSAWTEWGPWWGQ